MNKVIDYILNHKNYLLNLGTTFFSQFANAITLIILTPLLVKELGLNNFGYYGVIINVIAFSVILDFGLNIGLIRKFIHHSYEANTLINSLFIFFTTLIFILFPIFIFFYKNYFDLNNLSIIYVSILTAIIVIQNIFAVFFDSLIQTTNKIYISKIIRAIKLLVELFLILVFLKNITVIKILLITTIVNIFYLYTLFFYLKKYVNIHFNVKKFSFYTLWEHCKYSTWYFVSSLATVLVFNTQIILLNYISGPEIAAKYLAIVRFFDIIRIASTNFTQVLFPKIIHIEIENQWLLIKSMFFKILKRISLLIILLFLILFEVGTKLFQIWMGFIDYQIITLFTLYLVFTCLIIFDNVSVIFLSALKFNKTPTIISIIQGILGIFLSIIFLKQIGYSGLIIGFLCSFMLTNLIFNPLYLIRSINSKV